MTKRPPHKGTVSNGPARNAGPFLFPTKATPAKFWPVPHDRLPVQAAHVRRPICGPLTWSAGLPSATLAAACGAAGNPLPAVAGWRSKPPALCRRCRLAAWPVAGRPGRLAASRGRAAARGTVSRPLCRPAWPVIMPDGRRCRRLPPIRPPPVPRFSKFTAVL